MWEWLLEFSMQHWGVFFCTSCKNRCCFTWGCLTTALPSCIEKTCFIIALLLYYSTPRRFYFCNLCLFSCYDLMGLEYVAEFINRCRKGLTFFTFKSKYSKNVTVCLSESITVRLESIFKNVLIFDIPNAILRRGSNSC